MKHQRTFGTMKSIVPLRVLLSSKVKQSCTKIVLFFSASAILDNLYDNFFYDTIEVKEILCLQLIRVSW